MSSARNTPIGTPVVLAPGKIVLVGEYAALADGNTVEAAFGCYARAQFIPQKETATTMTMVAEIIERIKVELADLAPALPPGSVLLTNEDFRTVRAAVAGLGGSAAMAVAAVGAVLESLGLALESRKPLVFRIADAARRKAQGYLGSGSDTAAATYGGLIRNALGPDGHRQNLPLAPPAGLHLVVFAAGPSLPPAKVVQALERYARADAVSFLEAVAKLREAARRFLDEVGSGQSTAAIAAAGRYGEILQGLCVAAQAPIMNDSFARAAALARELGGIAKPTGAGGGEMGVALFATPEARQRFRKACTEPLCAFEGDLDTAGVRCEFADNAVVSDLDERDSAEIPESEPDEFDMPTVKTASPLAASLPEAVTVGSPVESKPTPADVGPGARPARRRHGLALVIVGLALALAGGYALYRSGQPHVPMARPYELKQNQPPPSAEYPPPTATEDPAPAPPAVVTVPTEAESQPGTASEARSAPASKRKPHGHANRSRHPAPRAGTLSPDEF
jgi:phosphomevalonate kinase